MQKLSEWIAAAVVLQACHKPFGSTENGHVDG